MILMKFLSNQNVASFCEQYNLLVGGKDITDGLANLESKKVVIYFGYSNP